jgi:hypothetical protein
MTRTVLKFAHWTIRPDRGKGAQSVIYAMQCVECAAHSGGQDTPAAAQDWALKHSGRHPSHRRYRSMTFAPWHTHMQG